jgi:hypothetical protein
MTGDFAAGKITRQHTKAYECVKKTQKVAPYS